MSCTCQHDVKHTVLVSEKRATLLWNLINLLNFIKSTKGRIIILQSIWIMRNQNEFFASWKIVTFLIKCSSNTGHLKHCFKTQLSQTKIVLQTKLSAPLKDKHTEIHYGEDIKHHDLSSESPIPWLNDDLYFCKLNLHRPRQNLVPFIIYHLKETILL